MVTLHYSPKNREKFVRLVEFFKDVLEICEELKINPVLSGSLAVLAYTGKQEMDVNDVDLSCSEVEFPRIVTALEARGIEYKLKEWHVLQILKGDLKVEIDSIEYWYKDLPMSCETLKVSDYKVNMLDLKSLMAFYRQGMKDRAEKTEENEKMKYEALKLKFEALEKLIHAS